MTVRQLTVSKSFRRWPQDPYNARVQCMSLKPKKPRIEPLQAQSIAVSVGLEGAILLNADVIRLLLRHPGKLGTQCWEVQIRNLLIEGLGQQIHIVLVSTVLFRVPQEIELTQNLIGERAGHDERGMTSRTTQIEQTSCSQDDDTMTIGEHKTIHLRLDVLDLDAWEAFQAGHVNLVVKVANIANNGIVLHVLHVLQSDDVKIPGG